MTRAAIANIKRRITGVFGSHAGIAPGIVRRLLPMRAYQGKLYEASVLAELCRALVVSEGCTVVLNRSTTVRFKSKGSHLNRTFPYFEVFDSSGNPFGEMFTDTYFNGISHHRIGHGSGAGDYHELDIVMVRPGVAGNIAFTDILLAVETKNTVIEKSIIREVLGFRRELSYLHSSQRTVFTTPPFNTVTADPPSLHLLYTSDASATAYQPNCNIFGTHIIHHTM